ncbi:DUF2231 domain-containing protein [Alkalicoccus urumqiensis]|uniref:DUF2231 domain-containing protein n=1 Tax=Alkalicoccus urumqiensis TaxID=1548213 RepID=A0A2P6MID3_ALKUR|nr:DUF2231 domain-containing protein [Alkalicoccus urumqiensis]PRO66030.1 hypothetical protein C6I21_06935 [Alkalicoccus urumqiensis]
MAYIIPDPLHPAVVHIPIALWIMGSLFLILSLWRPAFFDKAALWMTSIGTAGGVFSYFTGADAVGVALQIYGDSVGRFLGLHQSFALYTLLTYIAILVLQVVMLFKPNKVLRYVLVGLAVAGAVLVFLTGHYAGRLMYDNF